MKTIITSLLLTLISLSFPSIARSCPPLHDEAKVKEEILSGWGDDRISSNMIDYVSFLRSPKNADQCLVLVSLSDHGDCHACGATISIIELSADKNRWKRTFEQRDALSMGSFGKAPEASVLKLGKEGPGFRFELGGMQSGHVANTLVLVAKITGKYEEVLRVGTHYDNSGSGEDRSWAWDGRTEFIENRTAFPDIRISYSGTEKRDDTIVSVDRAELYSFADGEYKRVE